MDVTIDCICPKKGTDVRHPKGDTISLRDRMDFHGATTTQKAIGILYRDDPDASEAEVLATLNEHYLLFGIETWTLRDDKNQPVPVSKSAVRELLMQQDDAVHVISNAADDLYQSQVMLPLIERARRSLQPSPTDESTSPTSGEPPTPLKRSKRSSTSTSQTDATVTTTSSLDGDSSSSPSSVSAA